MLQAHALRVIGLDFDSTLFDANVIWLHRFRQQTGHITVVDNIKDWNFNPAIPAELLPALWAARSPEMYRMVRPIPGAVTAVAELAKQGHTLVVITADTGDYAKVKADLLRWHFPMVRHMVVAKDKWAAVPGMHVLVDDAAHNNPTNLVPQPWNSPRTEESWADRQYRFWRELPSRFDCC